MKESIPMVSPGELHAQMRQGTPVHLLDVRSTAEYREGHAAGALSVPLELLDAKLLQKRFGPAAGVDEPVHLICAGGLRAGLAANKLQAQGVRKLVVVEGGTQAWSQQQLPLRRTAEVMSLERQTQIALGLAILLMLTKGALLHPLFYLLVGVLGIGLVFSGVTGSCGLNSLLARMPWNRTSGGGVAASA